MASASSPTPASGSQRRRSMDAEINLVPFIDLLSMCICFLLITAVWINVGVLQVKQSSGTEAAATTADSLELDARFQSAQKVEFTFKRGGRPIRKQALEAENIPALALAMDAALAAWPETKLPSPTSPSPISAAMIHPKEGVSYGDLVLVMDMLRKHHISNLGVVPSGGT